MAAFKAQLEFLTIVSSCKKVSASDPQFANLLKPTSENIMKVTDIKDKNRAEKKLFNHLSEVAEGIPGLAWVTLVGLSTLHCAMKRLKRSLCTGPKACPVRRRYEGLCNVLHQSSRQGF